MRSIRFAALAVLAMIGAPLAHAQPPELDGDRGGWYLAPLYAAVDFDSSRGDGGANGYALAFGYRWRWIATELRGEYVESLTFVDRYFVPGSNPGDPPEERRETGEASLAGSHLSILVQPARLFGPLNRLAFLEGVYASVGAGMIKFQNTGQRRPDEKSFPFEGAVGYLHPVRIWGLGLSLRAEAAYRLDPHPQEPASEPDPQARYEDIVYRVGFQLPLSASASAASRSVRVVPLAYKDADADGVVDELDQCDDTPPNSLVNNKGCTPGSTP